MKVRVLFFAHLRERCGLRETVVEVPAAASVADLWEALVGQYPTLEGQTLRFAANQVYVDKAHTLHENDELALIPPVSGGLGRNYRTGRRRHTGGRSRGKRARA